MMQEKRRLTDDELREWGMELSHGENWDGVDADMVFRMMEQTAGAIYDYGNADWEFDITDAERLLAIMTPYLK